MSLLKELLALKESEQAANVAASDLKVDDEVHGQLDKAAKDDDMDAQCFGLEMEDGKVVKVYVKQDAAEEFEAALSVKLGEDDDIKTALEELGKDFEIIEIVWPDDDIETEDEESEDEESEDEESEDEDGSDALNSEVDYSDTKKKNESISLTIGQRFAKKLTELKWTGEEQNEYDKAVNKPDEELDDSDVADDSGDPHAPKEKAPQGIDSSWNVEKDEKGIKIANDRFSIELDDDETMELMNAIADKKIARFKNDHGKVVYVFSPRGSEYLLKTPEYQGGFRLPKDVVNKILD